MRKIYLLLFLIFFYSCQNNGLDSKKYNCIADSLLTNELVVSSEKLILSGYLDSAYNTLDKALKIYETCPPLKQTDNYILAQNNIGVYWIYKEGNYQKGLDYFKKALVEATNIHGKNYSEIPAYYNNIGFVYDAIGRYDSALYSFEIAMSLWYEDSIANADNIAKCYANLYSLNSRNGYPVKALDYAYKSLQIRKQLHGNSHSETAEGYCNVGISLLDVNMVDEAIENFKQAEIILENNASTSPRQLFSVYNSLGTSYSKLNNYTLSNTYYQKALQTVQNSEIGDQHPDYALIFSNIANNYVDLGKKKQALEAYKKSLNIYTKTMGANSLDAAITYGQIGTFYSNQKDYKNALNHYLMELNILKNTLGLYHNQTESCYRKVSKMYYKSGILPIAYTYQDSALMVKDSLQNYDNIRVLAETKEKYESALNKEEIKLLNAKNELATNKIINRNKLLIIILLISLGIIISIILFYNLNKQRNKLKYENELYKADIKAIRAQLNPHFIFNSLHSIRYYISENAGNLAEDYLIRFADLMRNVLMQSGQDTISLAEEIKTLELYLSLEKERLENRFDYTIIIDENIDPKQTPFPSLCIQPFTENAIKHAFGNSNKQGLLTVCITKQEHRLKVSINDNGPGMDATTIKSTSQGMKLTRDRIENYAALNKIDASFLVSSSKEGTKIEFFVKHKSFF